MMNKHKLIKEANYVKWIAEVKAYWYQRAQWKLNTMIRAWGIQGVIFPIKHTLQELMILMKPTNNFLSNPLSEYTGDLMRWPIEGEENLSFGGTGCDAPEGDLCCSFPPEGKG